MSDGSGLGLWIDVLLRRLGLALPTMSALPAAASLVGAVRSFGGKAGVARSVSELRAGWLILARARAGRGLCGRRGGLLVVSAQRCSSFPRGGSAQVTRALMAGPPPRLAGRFTAGRRARLAGPGRGRHNAAKFLLRASTLSAVDYSPALQLVDPLRRPRFPFQPSYEDRPNSPSHRVFPAAVDEGWLSVAGGGLGVEALARAGAAEGGSSSFAPPDAGSTRRLCEAFPIVPILGQLHGTELALLRALAALTPR